MSVCTNPTASEPENLGYKDCVVVVVYSYLYFFNTGDGRVTLSHSPIIDI